MIKKFTFIFFSSILLLTNLSTGHAKHCGFYPEDGVIPLSNPTLYDDVVAANIEYASTFTPQNDIIPSKNAAVLTCMDARVMPDQLMGYDIGEFHCIRNAGGRATEDAIRSLLISEHLLGTNQWFVVHHGDCGMMKFSQKVMDKLLAGSLVTSTLLQDCNEDWQVTEPSCVCKWKNETKCGSWKNRSIKWHTIENLKKSVIHDVKKIRNHPAVPKYIQIYGFIFVPNGESNPPSGQAGLLIPVKRANKIGRGEVQKCCKKNS